MALADAFRSFSSGFRDADEISIAPVLPTWTIVITITCVATGIFPSSRDSAGAVRASCHADDPGNPGPALDFP